MYKQGVHIPTGYADTNKGVHIQTMCADTNKVCRYQQGVQIPTSYADNKKVCRYQKGVHIQTRCADTNKVCRYLQKKKLLKKIKKIHLQYHFLWQKDISTTTDHYKGRFVAILYKIPTIILF